MKRYFGRFAIQDWITFSLMIALFGLTLLPVFIDVPTTGGWLRSCLITLGAATLGAIVLSQISSREIDKTLDREISTLRSLVQSSMPLVATHEVPAEKIRDELEQMLESSTEWYFRGGSARWQRERVLPHLATILDRPVVYKIQIISPFEPHLCEKYADYRRKSRPDDERATPQQIRYELLAFIYAVAVWAFRSKISPQITLLHRFSPFRLDGSSDGFLITVADVSKNGLKTNSGNWYYTSLLDEFTFEAGNSTELTLPAHSSVLTGRDTVESFFSSLRSLNPTATGSWDGDMSGDDWRIIYDLSGVEGV